MLIRQSQMSGGPTGRVWFGKDEWHWYVVVGLAAVILIRTLIGSRHAGSLLLRNPLACSSRFCLAGGRLKDAGEGGCVDQGHRKPFRKPKP